MKHLIKTVSFLAVMSVIPGAFAATSRASLTGKATSRLPSLLGYMNYGPVVSGTATSSGLGTLGVSECMDEYSECVRQDDVCGEDFAECTTNVLFHLQMPKCDSILLRCNSAGISLLFGSGATSVNMLSEVASYVQDEKGNNTAEVARYTYPLDSSKLGDWIQTAWKVNSLDVQQCSKKYATCLKRDNVCGADFELCTSDKEFKKQAVLCASTLARCSLDGKKALFGSTEAANTLKPDANSNLKEMIIAGAGLAAGNAVNTCYKVADQCILKACTKNPARCTVDKENAAAEMVEYIENHKAVPAEKVAEWASRITTRDKKTYIKNMCLETIGNNKYCYMTHVANGSAFLMENGKAISPEKFEELVGKLADFERQELYEEVYDDIYETRINTAVGQRIADLMSDYDAKTRDNCLETIRSCVMQTCGGGVGSVCYSQVFGDGSKIDGHINTGDTYKEIQRGCRAFINSDPSCQYSAVISGSDGYWTVSDSEDVFSTVFPTAGGKDLLGAVAALEGELSTAYSKDAINKMKTQCSNTAISCVKAMCGKDYSNCFRNRTDITAGVYNTGSSGFDNSMNKQSGVLDYNTVTGLCLNTIKNAKVCEEHLKIEAVKSSRKLFTLNGGVTPLDSAWGSAKDVRSGWLDSADSVVIGCRINSDNAPTDDCKNNNAIEKCGTVDDDGCVYDEEVTQSNGDYLISNAANTVFQEVLMDLEKEAQAKYRAKLNKQQNICLGNNNGGIKGSNDNGSTFMWVKLTKTKVPGSYPQKGLKQSDFMASDDLYGSFCRARITVVSDDKAINEKLGESATAYFAVGDAFECGSWISADVMKQIEDEVKKGAGMAGWKKAAAMAWSAVGGLALGGGVGALVGNYLANGKIGDGGLLNSDAKVEANNKTNAGSCVNNLTKCLDKGDNTKCAAGLRDADAAGINVNVNYAKGNNKIECGENIDLPGATWCPKTIEGGAATFCDNHPKCCEDKREIKTVSGDGKIKTTNEVVKNPEHFGKCLYEGKWFDEGKRVSGAISLYDMNDNETKTKISEVLQECRDKVNSNKSSKNATLAGAGIGALTGLGLGLGISKTVVDAKDNQAKDKKLAEWQQTMGEHIRCYIGGEDLAGYGDYVSFNFDDMN